MRQRNDSCKNVSGREALVDIVENPAADYSVDITKIEDEIATDGDEHAIDSNGFYAINELFPGRYKLMILRSQINDGILRSVYQRTVYEEIVGMVQYR